MTALHDVAKTLLATDYAGTCVVAHPQSEPPGWRFETDRTAARQHHDTGIVVATTIETPGGTESCRAQWAPEGIAEPTDDQLVHEAVQHHADILAEALDAWLTIAREKHEEQTAALGE